MRKKNKLVDFIKEKKLQKTIVVFGGILFLSIFISMFLYIYENNQREKAADYAYNNMRIFGLDIPKNLNFAGEVVPQTDFSIKESLDREFLVNTYWHSNAMLLFKRSNRWFPVIEPILKKNNIPDDFKYVALIESHLTNAISPRGATGFWQLMETAATHYGLEVSEDVDERYHVEKATEAACQYFNDAHAKFGNWTLAAASYNLGMTGIQNHLQNQQVSSYYDLSLNEETGRYVYKVLAIKSMLEDPVAYGFDLKEKYLYYNIPTISFKVDSSITDLTRFTIKKGYNLKILKLFNPWLMTNKLKNPTKKTYIIQFPRKEYLQRAFYEVVLDSLKKAAKNSSTKTKIKTDSAPAKTN